jgi:hypothetical protein
MPIEIIVNSEQFRESAAGPNGEAQAEVARSYNVSQATISRLGGSSPFEGERAAA